MNRNIASGINEVRFSEWFAVNLHQAYRAWTDPANIEQWFGPVGYIAEVLEMEVRVGGRWRFKMSSQSGASSHHKGRYVSVVPNEFLSFTWESEEDKELTGDKETLVSVWFEPVRGGVQITLVHQKLPNRSAALSLHHGWSSGFRKLDEALQIADEKQEIICVKPN
ncbi:SRPBCC domain-containing protein [uncultured Ruegeria sp.]|uniref:SRPBCC family protein n=1 Tax=uncultured Ruegeria sp. TaxID=259304 RepID=UPI0026169109|nr:SRPBCC domain-containing protein [uncultured Ruegeria sp.]